MCNSRTVLSPTLIAVFAVVLGGCGGADTKTPATAPADPVVKVDPRPRVQGTWRVVYRPKDYSGKTVRATWRISPSCSQGPCTFKVRSSRKFTFNAFKFDTAIGDYTYRARGYTPCGRGDKISVQRGYAFDRQFNLQITASEKSSTGLMATRMKGNDVTDYRTTKKASLANCSDSPKQTDSAIAVQIRP